MSKKVLKGTVISNKMDKTIVVLVERVKEHPKYKKKYRVTKKYKVHDEKNECKIGDVVRFVETRPISKEKKWKIISKLKVKTKKTKSQRKNQKSK